MCGITRVEDALCAANLGVDAIGLMFYAPSPRYIELPVAKHIVQSLPPMIDSVGVFVDASIEFVNDVLSSVPLSLLQFHGDESPEYCESFARPYIKAVRMSPDVDLFELAETYASARALLLDTYVPGLPGGTGECFDWSKIPHTLTKPVILAGGLNATNIGDAARAVKPYAVDVSGAIEIEKGVKDRKKMAEFVMAVSRLGEYDD